MEERRRVEERREERMEERREETSIGESRIEKRKREGDHKAKIVLRLRAYRHKKDGETPELASSAMVALPHHSLFGIPTFRTISGLSTGPTHSVYMVLGYGGEVRGVNFGPF